MSTRSLLFTFGNSTLGRLHASQNTLIIYTLTTYFSFDTFPVLVTGGLFHSITLSRQVSLYFLFLKRFSSFVEVKFSWGFSIHGLLPFSSSRFRVSFCFLIQFCSSLLRLSVFLFVQVCYWMLVVVHCCRCLCNSCDWPDILGRTKEFWQASD